MLQAALADVLPVAASGWAAWWLLRSTGLYRFGRSERLLSHLGRVCATTAVAIGVAAFAHWLLPAAQTTATDTLELGIVWGGGLVILHAAWWVLVTRWRSLGWLTPNLVVVGATDHAEDLIATAIERRDMNILGIFDDRPERSPRSMLGVPVLGTTETMLRHRVMPYVDLIVVTVDPRPPPVCVRSWRASR